MNRHRRDFTGEETDDTEGTMIDSFLIDDPKARHIAEAQNLVAEMDRLLAQGQPRATKLHLLKIKEQAQKTINKLQS
uniref:Uncharacterized protein n=1 Tax=viral metagenome TaxID=1070528 RepID=A0A6M3Y1I6_9ZZZZ